MVLRSYTQFLCLLYYIRIKKDLWINRVAMLVVRMFDIFLRPWGFQLYRIVTLWLHLPSFSLAKNLKKNIICFNWVNYISLSLDILLHIEFIPFVLVWILSSYWTWISFYSIYWKQFRLLMRIFQINPKRFKTAQTISGKVQHAF